jgi:hypothetical protein
MANIKIVVNGPLVDGHKVTFRAPSACVVVEYLDVRYVKDNAQASKLFTMKDAHGNTLTGIGNLFEEGAYVHVILDTIRGFAYLQNADTNGYLEGKIGQLSNDYIVAQGTSGIWSYRKWNSGIAECWGTTANNTVDINGPWGAIYHNNGAIPSISYPFAFIERPNFFATPVVDNYGYWLLAYNSGSATATPTLNVLRGMAAEGANVSANLHAIGRWK